ncbi:HD domain-containing protein [Infirmifilum lucidum]|uniref:HD domain-containing protein n=1 Tax=Infirmifilum lucidum TaxID=2776706 RepID=A0A7L9FFS7_9CREN|nr:HD domain-containing protein [Infirmifilum lucidum]QOJ78212.1 HD domain-containing protein [Infirmifilum lucidum]
MVFAREIYDEVHGFVDLTPLEEELIKSCPLTRLHRVKQLGPAFYIYPSATHTRLAHSIGTMHLADRMYASAVNGDAYERQLIRLAGLLHDVGHLPFSHALPGDHEALGLEVIRNLLSDIISEYLLDLIEVLTGRHKLSPIIASEIDADRLDYLLRDAHHLGLPYRMVDLERILRSAKLARVDGKWVLAFEQGAEVAVEALLVTRLSLFRRVYLHKHVAGLEALLARIYMKMVEEGFVEPPLELVKSEKWCFFDDCALLEAMKAASTGKGWLAEASHMFLKGELLQMVFEARLGSDEELQEAVSQCPVPREWVFLHRPKLVPFRDPSKILIEVGGEVVRLSELGGTLLEKLASYVYSPVRVYTKPEYARALWECLYKRLLKP